MRTKDKILNTALQLLNEHGVKSVTIRDVAAEMGISHGNVGYHYANMEFIIYALYEKLVKEMDAVISSMQFSGIHLQMVYDSNKIMFTKFYEYRFLFIDFVAIGRSIPRLRKHYLALQKKRAGEFFMLLMLLKSNNILSSKFSDEQYGQLIQSLTIFGDFWISSSELVYNGKKDKRVDYYLDLFFALIQPYLTKEGQKQYLLLQK